MNNLQTKIASIIVESCNRPVRAEARRRGESVGELANPGSGPGGEIAVGDVEFRFAGLSGDGNETGGLCILEGGCCIKGDDQAGAFIAYVKDGEWDDDDLEGDSEGPHDGKVWWVMYEFDGTWVNVYNKTGVREFGKDGFALRLGKAGAQ